MTSPNLYVRIKWENGVAIGPEQIRMLEAVREMGSIYAAAKLIGVSYTHIWRTLLSMNAYLCGPVIASANKGTRLTPFGQRLVQEFRLLEATANKATSELNEFWSSAPSKDVTHHLVVGTTVSK